MRGAWDAAASELGLGLAGAGGGHCRASVGLVCVTSTSLQTSSSPPYSRKAGGRRASRERMQLPLEQLAGAVLGQQPRFSRSR